MWTEGKKKKKGLPYKKVYFKNMSLSFLEAIFILEKNKLILLYIPLLYWFTSADYRLSLHLWHECLSLWYREG